MGPITIRRWIRRLRRHAAALLLVLWLGGAIALHHGDFAPGGMHHDTATAAVQLCLGAFTAIGAAVAAIALGIVVLGRWPTFALLGTGSSLMVWRNGSRPRVRAGPSPSLVCVWRW